MVNLCGQLNARRSQAMLTEYGDPAKVPIELVAVGAFMMLNVGIIGLVTPLIPVTG